jgi:general stress protein 26
MRETRVASLTYTDRAGRLVSAPMATQEFDDPATVFFLIHRASDKVAAIVARPMVNVAYASDSGWVSLSGTARVNDDRELLGKLWDPAASAFLSGGPDDPDSTVLEVDAQTAHYWDSPGKVSMVVEVAKGLLTDAQPDLGDDGVVDLGHS